MPNLPESSKSLSDNEPVETESSLAEANPRQTERRIIVQNELKNTSEEQNSSEVFQLLKANTSLAVWLLFLAIGGGLMALYYARIGYLPDIEWSSALVYLAAASIIGGGVGTLLAMSVLLPGILWADFLIFDSNLKRRFWLDETEEPCIRTIIQYLGVPFCVALLTSHLALYLGTIGYWIVSAITLTVFFVVMRKVFGEIMSTTKEPTRYTFMYSFWFNLSILLSQISMFVIYLISDRPNGRSFAILTVTCTLGVLISNHVVAVRYKEHPRQAVVAALVAAAVLVFTADKFAPISLKVMKFYGLGNDVTVDVLINEKDAQTIKDLGLTKCADPSGRRLHSVQVLSKLGNEFLMKCEGQTFTLPKSVVVSLQSAGSVQGTLPSQ